MSARRTVFYSGEAMSPLPIRRADPTARFIARGAVSRDDRAIPDRFVGQISEQVWGIAVEVDGDGGHGDSSLDVTLDDGRMLIATLAETLLGGDPAAVLANSRYWELPPAYVATLAAALNVVEDE